MSVTTMNDLMNVCQMIKLENRANTKIKSIKLVFGRDYDGARNCFDTLEIEIG